MEDEASTLSLWIPKPKMSCVLDILIHTKRVSAMTVKHREILQTVYLGAKEHFIAIGEL